MANQAQPDSSDSSSKDDIDEILERANPNPERVGCPPRDVLVTLARRTRPIGDPAYEHLVKCSPCYREFRRLQQTGLSRGYAPGVRARWIAAAAVLAVLVGGGWYLISQPQNAGRSAVLSEQLSTTE